MHPVAERMSVPGLFVSLLEEEGTGNVLGKNQGWDKCLLELQGRNRERAFFYQHVTSSIPNLIKLKLSPQ